jgi:murein DD-endopeptidase MepM/ murein hydrolase activator NlpD
MMLSQYGWLVTPWSGRTAVHEPADAVIEPAGSPAPGPSSAMGSDSSVPAATTSPAAATTGADSVIGPDRSSPVELDRRDLLIPVQGVTAEHLTGSQFDDKRGGARKHEALDILAPRNTPVLAVENGTIARLFLSKAGGITVYQFDPTGSYAYYYAHLERYADGLREGQQVRRGQTLGYVGTSGNAPKDTPHLHFAIFRLTEEKRWWEGTPIDPYEVLR